VSGVIALWGHSRSASTAFLRMMIERGDVLVAHEPLLHLTETGTAELPAPGGGAPVAVHTMGDLLARLRAAGEQETVFVKEVLDYPYEYLFEHPAGLASFTHTFIVRDPRQTISSHYAMKPTVTSPEIGYERLFRLFELVMATTGREPLVMRAEHLIAEPEQAVREYCAYVGLPYRPEALRWRPGERSEWQRHRGWHVDASQSAGFQDTGHVYADTVDNNPTLRAFYDHHLPFYQRIVRYAR
jgi:Sulfotransferase domain